MKGSSRKKDYICVNKRETDEKMKLQGGDAVKVDRFIYLWCTIQSKGQCTREMKKRAQDL